MKKNVHFDVDGVLRDLNIPVCGGDPDTWDIDFKEDDSYKRTVDNDLSMLLTAPQTIYFPVICEYLRKCEIVNVITSQPLKWIPNTITWLNTNLGSNGVKKFNIKFVSHIKEKEQYISNNEVLVEDYPHFSKKMSRKIILIDKKYNQEAMNFLVRIKTPEELRKVLANV